MSKFLKITTLSAAAMFCLAGPSFAQYGSGSAYGGGNTISDGARAQANAERAAKRAAKKAAKEEKKRLEAAELKETAKKEIMEKEAHMAKEELMAKEAMMKKEAVQNVAPTIIGKPTNCPAGTTAQDNGTCMLN